MAFKEFETRINILRDHLAQENIDLALLVDPHNQYYFTNFYALTYSRPIFTLISESSVEIILPKLEEEHAKQEAYADEIHVYYEHPERANVIKSPYKILFDVINKGGYKTIGIEKNVFPVSLSEDLKNKTAAAFKDIENKIGDMRLIKSEMEISLIKSAAQLVDFGVRESIEKTEEGLSELEIDAIGTMAILKLASERFPNIRVDCFSMSPSGIERTVLPHVFSSTRKIRKGDIIIHSRQVAFKGYRSENERTFFFGTPSKKVMDIFEVMTEAQKAAISAIREGVTCKEIDNAARSVIREAGYANYFFHRTGHGLGLSVHEPPYLRYDKEIVLKEGMVVSIEPGIYIPSVGGFRHSDTIIIRKNYGEVITKVPRTLNYLVR
ncbi:MAG: aminopeptidase P family protein [Thermoproteota archaeon]|nr:MAG: aminopeptidase P family protein [Candidatus Korarchaeota archaeon]